MALFLQCALFSLIYMYSTCGFVNARILMAHDIYEPSKIEEELPPIILFHGLFDSKKTWKHIGPKLAESTGRKVYTTDLRNHGDSFWSDNFTFAIVDEDVRNLLAEYNVTKAVFLGHSIGGRVAMNLALDTPELVEKLIVEDMIPNNYNSLAVGMMKYLVKLLKKSISIIPPGVDEEEAKQTIFNFWKSVMINEYMFDMKKYDLSMLPMRKNGSEYVWETNLDVVEAGLNSDEVKKKISGVYPGDVIFIYGTNSFLSVEKDVNIYELFPRAYKLAFDGAAHYIHNEFPSHFLREVTKFITGRLLLSSEC